MFPIEPGGYMRTWGRLGPVGRRGARRFSCYHEIQRSYQDPGVFGAGGRMETRRPMRPCRNPEVSSLHPEKEPGGTVLRLPRQGYYLYLFGFRIMPLGSWPLSSSYDGDSFLSKLVSLLKDDFHLSYGSINHSAWKPHARGRTQNRGHGPRPGGRNPEPGSRTLE
ncbi:hypothetical protein F2Q68_00009767 [Brassica cretica]|uniref:Uncharacterized protein n=1 Tax=Brassica cretica TaxID=69181 RepID=A0A3N6S204_BRACR|nr:hypothetical protein F2Q68_00009767 [Brassica cretica]